jgi:predicted ArsR family transcriptional regulator
MRAKNLSFMQKASKMSIDEINSEILGYMKKSGKVKAKELAEFVGIGVPSIRVRLFQLMAMGLVKQEKTRDHQVWFFVKEEKP